MGPRSENRGYVDTCVKVLVTQARFNGSTVREPWLWICGSEKGRKRVVASMGPRSENRGYGPRQRCRDAARPRASMGPRSENRGYADAVRFAVREAVKLQWVHGPRTVVM